MAGDTVSDFRSLRAYMNETFYPEAASLPLFYGGYMEKKYWEDKEYSYFSHKKCEYFPCHKGADPDNFNCLFCYCPLYALGDRCGGNFRYTENGLKDCTNCQLPHKKQNYGYVTGKYQELAELMKRNRGNRTEE